MKRLLVVLSVILAVLLTYGAWWLFLRSPERQIAAAQASFRSALESHDWDQVRATLAPDFVSSAGHNADTVMPDLRQALEGFVTLDIEAEQVGLQTTKDLGVISEKIRLIGLGSSMAIAVRERANQVRTPWLFHWRKNGSWPWDWQLTQVHNDSFP